MSEQGCSGNGVFPDLRLAGLGFAVPLKRAAEVMRETPESVFKPLFVILNVVKNPSG